MELSKSKKKKLRVARAKKVRLLMDPNQPHLHLLTDEDGNFSNTPRDGYKKRQKIYCKVDFFKISTREQLPHRYFFCKEETQEDGESRFKKRKINTLENQSQVEMGNPADDFATSPHNIPNHGGN